MLPVVDVVVGLGGNLGDRETTLAAAVSDLGTLGTVLAVSALYETAPVGPPQPAYLNAAARVETPLSSRALLEDLLAIERRYGRERREKWGPRTLDLDILWIYGEVVSEGDLVVPHARLRERRFALVPLLDVAPDARHPTTGELLGDWLAELPDEGIRWVESPLWAPLSTAFQAARMPG
jgi:2-amino-4-hydroxy-6-hydroxymethyldihydropteridine diphosphokinase